MSKMKQKILIPIKETHPPLPPPKDDKGNLYWINEQEKSGKKEKEKSEKYIRIGQEPDKTTPLERVVMKYVEIKKWF